MSELRDLDEAHARIAELSALLGGGSPEPRRPVLAVVRWAALVFALLVLSSVVALGVGGPPVVIVRRPPPPPPPPFPDGVLEVWSPRFIWDTNGPALVDVIGEGSAHDLVMPAWRRGRPDAAMHVVALRRGTYDVLWRSKPLPSGRRGQLVSLAATGGLIAVSDAFGAVHILDAHGGTEAHVVHPPPFTRLLAPANRPGFVYAIPEVDSRGSPSRIQLASGRVEPAAETAHSLDRECRADGTRTCQLDPLPSAKSKLQAMLSQNRGDYSWDLVGDDSRVTIADVSMDHRFPELTLFAWDESSAKFRWKGSVAPPPQRALESSASSSHQWITIGHGRILAVYHVGSAGHRLSAHDSQTGRVLYDVPIPELPYGSEVERLTLDGDAALVVTSGALLVFDAKVGQVVRTLRSF